MSWRDKIRRYFRPVGTSTITLAFELDRGDQGHRVRLVKRIGDQNNAVTNLSNIAQVGYHETHELDGKLVTFNLAEPDLRTLYSLRSMNPKPEGDGWWRFPFAPPVLDYLRKKPNVAESKLSQALHVEKENPLVPAARVDFDAEAGIVVETGYKGGDGVTLEPLEALPRTQDGQFVVVGDAFRPIVQPKSERAIALLNLGRSVIAPDDIPEFFKRDLVMIRNEFGAVLTDQAQLIDIDDTKVRPTVKVNKSADGWLNFAVEFSRNGKPIPDSLLPKVGGVQYVRVDDTTWLKVDAKEVERSRKALEQLTAEVTEAGYRVPVAQFASLEDFIEKLGGKKELNREYQQFLEQLNGFEPNEQYRLSDGAETTLRETGITLRPYQRSGIHWLSWLDEHYLHGILADDMGLGKTLQTILQLRQAYEQSAVTTHSLILAPRSVLPHWEREIARFFPAAQTYRYHGPNREERFLQSNKPLIFISTYATIANDISLVKTTPFFYVVLDEATYIKNPTARRAQAVKQLNAAHRIALSGTPVENRPSELWSLFDFLMRGHLGKYGTFARVFENPITTGDTAASDRLGKRIKPFLLRRLKEEVAKDLPEKIELDEWCSLSDEQRQLYGGLQEQVKSMYASLQEGETVNYTSSILPVLTKLKQICDHPAIVTGEMTPVLGRSNKFDLIIEKVTEIRAAKEQVVIFSHFLGMLSLFEAGCKQKGWDYIRLDGSVNKRQPLIDRFNNRQVPIALCSIQATGYGINLTAANHVIHADRWWNPAVEDQATDRVHRIGQDKTVYVYRILVEGTLEERIDKLLTEKRAMAGSIMGAARGSGKAWTREELLEILKPLS